MKNRIGILLINLGTPEATSYWPMRRYLKEFLSDKRVIEAKGPVWWMVLNGIILTKRPKKSGRAYDEIWNKELDESPLKTITRGQAEKVAAAFADNPAIEVDWGMRYGKPAIGEGINRLLAKGCQRILLFPLYPQYSAATTATAMDKVYETLQGLRHQPDIRTVRPYFDEKPYISALAASICQHRKTLDWTPEVMVASFHGLPVDFITNGDPYQAHCEATVAMLRKALKVKNDDLLLTYQSRTGRAEWIGPDTEDVLSELAAKGVRKVLVLTPGFASDCVETLEEIQIRAAEVFTKSGGTDFAFVPCLNDSEGSVEMMTALIDQELAGWI